MFTLNDWMSESRIKQALNTLDFYRDSFDAGERSAAAEGIACLKDAKPEYLMNLLPQDHPDRIKAMELLNQ